MWVPHPIRLLPFGQSLRAGSSPVISKGGLAYSQEDIDFIAAYVAPHQAWYVIPIEALEGAISIRLYPRLCPGGKSKRSGAFYEAYREAWHLLKQPEASETAPNIQNGTNRAAVANAAK